MVNITDTVSGVKEISSLRRVKYPMELTLTISKANA